jgi:hypothetical protein
MYPLYWVLVQVLFGKKRRKKNEKKMKIVPKRPGPIFFENRLYRRRCRPLFFGKKHFF